MLDADVTVDIGLTKPCGVLKTMIGRGDLTRCQPLQGRDGAGALVGDRFDKLVRCCRYIIIGQGFGHHL